MSAQGRALSDHRPALHHSDQGVQYAATAYIEILRDHDILISMADVGAAWQHSYAERRMRTIKEEAVDLSEYRDYGDAYQQIGRFLDDVYMRKRIHSSLGYLTPVALEAEWTEPFTPASLGVRNAQKVSGCRCPVHLFAQKEHKRRRLLSVETQRVSARPRAWSPARCVSMGNSCIRVSPS